MRPNGRRVNQSVEIPDTSRSDYEMILSRGWNLAAEVLMSGMVSITVESEEQDEAMRVVPNGPNVIDAIQQVLAEAAKSG